MKSFKQYLNEEKGEVLDPVKKSSKVATSGSRAVVPSFRGSKFLEVILNFCAAACDVSVKDIRIVKQKEGDGINLIFVRAPNNVYDPSNVLDPSKEESSNDLMYVKVFDNGALAMENLEGMSERADKAFEKYINAAKDNTVGNPAKFAALGMEFVISLLNNKIPNDLFFKVSEPIEHKAAPKRVGFAR